MTDLATYFSIPLIQNMFVTTVLACILCGVVGTFVVVNRMVAVTGGIAHTTFGGVGFAYFAMSVLSMEWMTPMAGALVFGISSAIVMTLCKVFTNLRQDTVIGVMWAIGMALGVIFMGAVDRSRVTPSSYESILFGNVLFVSDHVLLIVAVSTVLVLTVVTFFYRDLQALVFDEVHARLSGINTTMYNLLLYVLIAVVCVMASKAVGIIMVIALMTIPAAMANLFAKDLREMMVIGASSSAAMAFLGLIVSLVFDTAPGATVVLIVGLTFVISVAVKKITERVAVGDR